MIVEELVTKLGLEVDSGALATLEKFRSAVSGGLATMGVAAVGVAGAFVAMVHSVGMAGDEIDATATKIGITTDALQELRHAADMSDVSAESLGTGLKFLSKNAAEAAHGSTEAMKAFAGIGLRDAAGKIKSPDALLRASFDTLRKLPTAAERTERAMKLFGRSGSDLVPMFSKTNAELDSFIQEAHDLGLVLDEDTIKAGSDFDDALKRVKGTLTGLKNAFAGPFVRVFADALTGLAVTLKGLRPFFTTLSASFRDAGERMGGMIAIFKRGAEAFANWFGDSALGKILNQTKGFKVLEAVLIGLGVIFVAVAAQAIGAWLAAAAPFILLAALIGFIVDDIYNFIKGNDSLIGRIQKWADAIGDPSEHPIVLMLRKALSYLMDLADPKKAEEFKRAWAGAVDFVSEKIRVALGGKKFTRNNPNAPGLLVPEDYTGPSAPKDEGIKLPGFMQGKGKWDRAIQEHGIFGQGGLLDAMGFRRSGEGLAGGMSVAPPAAGAAQVTNNVTINGSNLSGEELQSRVENALDASYSKAFPATSGGEN